MSLDQVRHVIENAVDLEAPPDDEPPGDRPREGGGDYLAEDCPVTPLGIAGTVRYYLDAKRQLVALEAKEHSRLQILGLFSHEYEWLYRVFPRMDKRGVTTGWRPEAAAERLMAACAARGVWDPVERERGLGAWRGADGQLVLHLGDRIVEFPASAENAWNRMTQHAPGLVGRHVYPAGPRQPRPSPLPAPAGDGGPGAALLGMLRTWSMRRGEVDAVLMLGWIGSAMIGGALDWRPLIWITGGRGTGKSTLHKLLKLVLDDALIETSDATEAGIRQKQRRGAIPVAIDEIEAEEDNRRMQNVVKLARQAASGGKALRGGHDHQGVEFTVQCAFLFSSILMPPLLGQDRSRMAIIELAELPAGAPAPTLEAKRWREIGAQLRRRLVDGWARFGTTLEFYRAELTARGHSARGADQFGTLLACADILLNNGDPCSDAAEAWVSKLEAATLAEADDDVRDEERCLQHLLSSSVDPYRGGARRTLGHWLRVAARDFAEPSLLEDGSGDQPDEDAAIKLLGTYGLKVVPEDGKRYVAIANQHNGLSQIFAGTHWAARSGATGVWVQALRRLPGAERSKKTLYFGGVYAKATIVPLDVACPSLKPTEP